MPVAGIYTHVRLMLMHQRMCALFVGFNGKIIDVQRECERGAGRVLARQNTLLAPRCEYTMVARGKGLRGG